MSALHLAASAPGQESEVLSKRSGETRLVAIADFVRKLCRTIEPLAAYGAVKGVSAYQSLICRVRLNRGRTLRPGHTVSKLETLSTFVSRESRARRGFVP